MRLKITCNYPSEEVKELVKFASRGVNHKHLTVWIKNCKHHAFAGRYYHYGHVVARIGNHTGFGTDAFPVRVQYPRRKRAPEYWMNNWKECLVAVTAHELRHHYQHKHGKPASENDAERWALKRLEAYRASLA